MLFQRPTVYSSSGFQPFKVRLSPLTDDAPNLPDESPKTSAGPLLTRRLENARQQILRPPRNYACCLSTALCLLNQKVCRRHCQSGTLSLSSTSGVAYQLRMPIRPWTLAQRLTPLTLWNCITPQPSTATGSFTKHAGSRGRFDPYCAKYCRELWTYADTACVLWMRHQSG